ncbi:MAG: DUF2779 domain-containing protein [bacterium]
MPVISKSKFIEGLQCPKLLWYEFNRKSEIPKPDAMAKAVMDEGNKVGAVARQAYPGGILLERDWNFQKMHDKSLQALSARQPLFEAGFLYNDAYAIADILLPVEADAWDLIEVKSSTNLKATYYDDVAFQKYTYQGAGLKIRGTYLMNLNRDYIKRGAIEPAKLLKKEEVSERVGEKLGGIEAKLAELQKIIAGKEPPDIPLCPGCRDCRLSEACGYTSPVSSRKAQFDKEAIKTFLRQIEYPVYYLDFETLAPAVPIYDLTHPYEEVPFQFSLHEVAGEGAAPIHYSYLAPGDVDPRPEVLARLKELLKDKGSILAYNATYEKNCLRRMAEAYPEYQSWLEATAPRFIDLWLPFKNRHFYDPQQAESTSMKAVLPALVGTSYDGLEIKEGFTARTEYLRVVFGTAIEPADRQKVFNALEKYCEQDTLGMVQILDELKRRI